MNSAVDPRRADKVNRFKPTDNIGQIAGDDLIPDYMNILGTGRAPVFVSSFLQRLSIFIETFFISVWRTGMIFSMCGLMMKLKWCAWLALYCSCISFANSRASDDAKQVLSSFMLSVSAVVMSYLQNPAPMTPPWATA